MIDLVDLFTTFGDVIELDFPTWNIEASTDVLSSHPGWKPYNPRKPNNREGLSITSLDGGYGGIPDLDSIREYNSLHGTSYSEFSFQKRTDVVNSIAELPSTLDSFPNLGRCHFLRLGAGGFFPPHRDNGTALPSKTVRIIVPLQNTNTHSWKWVQEDRILNLTPGRTYCINTSKEHSVFSFVDNCCLLVLNVIASPRSIKSIASHIYVK
jgi:hypothetical protein